MYVLALYITGTLQQLVYVAVFLHVSTFLCQVLSVRGESLRGSVAGSIRVTCSWSLQLY